MSSQNWPQQQPTQQAPPSGWGAQPTNPPATQPPAGPPPPPQQQAPPQQQQLFPQTPEPGAPITEPPTAVQQPEAVQATQTTALQTEAAAAPTILQLLREFSKKDGCDRYSSDGEKVKLLVDYLWLRQLTPALPFETFLELYAPIANFDKENLKHPDDAIKHHLPRAKKQAEERGVQQWSAKDVVDYVALFVDIIRAAESTSTPVPMQFNDFLTNAAMIEQFRAGAFKEPSAPRGGSRKKTTSATAGKEPPTAANQRCLYNAPGGRQHRGYTTEVWQDQASQNWYANFRADSGEQVQGIGLGNLERCEDPPPNPPSTPEGEPKPELGHGKLTIPKAQFPQVLQALGLQAPVGTVALGDMIYGYNHQFQDGKVALIEVINGETKPYVDARLCEGAPDNVVAEVPPRDAIEGVYTFETADGSYTLEVSGNQ